MHKMMETYFYIYFWLNTLIELIQVFYIYFWLNTLIELIQVLLKK